MSEIVVPHMDDRAFSGPIGDVVRELEPETEAAPEALLLNLLAMVGNAVGAAPHVRVGGDLHSARLFFVIVGKTARARKGTASSLARWVMESADPGWSGRILGGFGSGEAVVDAVRDPDDDDEGVTDHRLLVREGEFARVLRVAERDGSTLSPIIRDAWDGGRLQVRTRKTTSVASRAHVCVLGDITLEELRSLLCSRETANGFANRFGFGLVERSKRLPGGGSATDDRIAVLAAPLKQAISESRRFSRFSRTPNAEELWTHLYEIIDDEQTGLVGAVTARAEAQVLRLSLVYALADGASQIGVGHLVPAVAVWDFLVASAWAIFSDAGEDRVVTRLLP